MKRTAFLGLVISIGIATFFSSGCTKKSDTASANEIVIGEYGSMTGNEATFGQSTDKGIRLAIDEKNAAGGIKGKHIRLVAEDNQGKQDETAAVVRKLITRDKIVALLGEVASNRSLIAAPIAQQAKIPMITPSSTNPEVTKVGDYVFRVCFIDPFQGSVMARFAHDHLKVKKVAILKDQKSDYSLGLAEFFTKKFTELGGTIVGEATFQNGDTDFKAQLTQIRGEQPEAIFIPAYYTEVGLIARQAKQLGIKAVLLGGDGWDSPKLFEIGQAAIDGAYFSNHYATESPVPATQEFIKKYKTKYNETPDGLAAMGYDAANVLIAAMEAAPELTPAAIRTAIAETKNFPGSTGTITLNADRNPDKEAFVVQVKGKGLKFVTKIEPQ
jgi:branched-chain amino acid transport system substrate-binding protein